MNSQYNSLPKTPRETASNGESAPQPRIKENLWIDFGEFKNPTFCARFHLRDPSAEIWCDGRNKTFVGNQQKNPIFCFSVKGKLKIGAFCLAVVAMF